MELLGLPFLGAAQGGLYSDEDARRARASYLESVLLLFGHIASVDAFQQWLYTAPEGADADARDAKWLELRALYEPGLDWSGLGQYRAARWYAQQHAQPAHQDPRAVHDQRAQHRSGVASAVASGASPQRHPVLGAAQPHGTAIELRKRIREGIDPQEERAKLRSEPTVAELAREYIECPAVLKLRSGTVRGYREMLRDIIVPRLGHLRLSAVGKRDVDAMHHLAWAERRLASHWPTLTWIID